MSTGRVLVCAALALPAALTVLLADHRVLEVERRAMDRKALQIALAVPFTDSTSRRCW
ncbi:hypothetical protein AURDEDRAFT_160616 [Auricularia subglabra TFB-10046 SS5]|nr:hypothetical protein AURDEDRAFT_160616 [Auricularia subglabra TFB-10046 SS5]